jgi:hypothetical protein
MTMLAKIKDNVVVTFPYGYDNLQSENPHTRFTGNIDLMELFPQTEEALLRGHELVQVTAEDKPATHPIEQAVLATTPTLENGNWVLKWAVSFKLPGEG